MHFWTGWGGKEKRKEQCEAIAERSRDLPPTCESQLSFWGEQNLAADFGGTRRHRRPIDIFIANFLRLTKLDK